jgi:hypothetical protein
MLTGRRKLLKEERFLVSDGRTLLWNECGRWVDGAAGRAARGQEPGYRVVGAEYAEGDSGNGCTTNHQNNQKGIHGSITFTSSHLDV